MEPDEAAKIFTMVIAFIAALSGWVKVLLDQLANKPKLAGRILCVMKGEFSADGYAPQTSYMVYPYLLNKRKNSVHLLDYEFYIKLSRFGKWLKIDRVYGLEGAIGPSFRSGANSEIGFNDLNKTMIYLKKEPVQHGVPLHGWIPFFGDISYAKKTSFRYRLICIDAYGGRHKITSTKKNNIVNQFLLMEIAGVVFPQDMLNNTLPKKQV